MVRVFSSLVVVVGLLACTVDGGEEGTFGVPTGAGSNPGSSPGSADDGSGSGSGSGETTAGSSGSGDTMGTSTGNPLGDSSGAPTTTDVPGDGSSTGMPPGNGGQPAMGMYSDCLDAMLDCVAPTNVCLVINMNDGFCTNQGCANPAVDCTASPGGTATPVCFPTTLDGMPAMSCALSCAGGLTCPAGMMCYPLAEGSICA